MLSYQPKLAARAHSRHWSSWTYGWSMHCKLLSSCLFRELRQKHMVVFQTVRRDQICLQTWYRQLVARCRPIPSSRSILHLIPVVNQELQDTMLNVCIAHLWIHISLSSLKQLVLATCELGARTCWANGAGHHQSFQNVHRNRQKGTQIEWST